MDTVCVVGLGYVGLPTALIAAEHGYHVVGYDNDAARVAQINAGSFATQEPELCERFTRVHIRGTFSATTTVPNADYFIIAVPTPVSIEKSADLTYVFSAVRAIAPYLKNGNTVIIESTVPVGTTDMVAKILEQESGLRVGVTLFVAHAPERVLPGRAFKEIVENDRIIGGITQNCARRVAQFYEKFVTGALSLNSACFAELVKLVENSFADVHIAFAHQVAALAEAYGLNPYQVVAAANEHPRVHIATPTCGVGGHCVAVDPWFLIDAMPEKTPLLRAARLINDQRPELVAAYVKNAVHAWCIAQKKDMCVIHALGLTYKPNVDDLRESPAVRVVQNLMKEKNIKLLVSEPHVAQEKLEALMGNVVCTFTEGQSRTDLTILLVGHDVWKNIHQRISADKLLDFSGLTLRRMVNRDAMNSTCDAAMVGKKTVREISS